VCHVLIEIEIEIVTSKKYKYSRDVRLRTPQRTQKLAVVTMSSLIYMYSLQYKLNDTKEVVPRT